jgi:hypothetical protein
MMESTIFEIFSKALDATSLIAFFGWWQADKRAQAEREEGKSIQARILGIIEKQSENQQRTADMLADLKEKIGLL